VTFALPKVGLVLPTAQKYVGELHVVDISIPIAVTAGSTEDKGKSASPSKNVGNTQNENDSAGSFRYLITDRLVREWWPRRTGTEHKGNFGRVLVIAGSRGMSGAAVMAAQAAARSGAGLVTLGVPAGIHDIAETKLTEVMTFPLPQNERGTLSIAALEEIIDRAANCDVLALGPGLGTGDEIAELVKEILLKLKIPCVLDADGLNVLAGKTELFKAVQPDLVLTPHPGEMSRLTGRTTEQIQNDRLGIAAAKAAQWGSVMVLKGAGTVVAGPDGTLFINNTGNPGMAAGGSGDVLTGIIAGLLAQGMPALQAAAAWVYLHGLAGDAAALDKGMAGLLAGDILEQLPAVLKTIE
jgi:NAD(P)H-hydrate epimerase